MPRPDLLRHIIPLYSQSYVVFSHLLQIPFVPQSVTIWNNSIRVSNLLHIVPLHYLETFTKSVLLPKTHEGNCSTEEIWDLCHCQRLGQRKCQMHILSFNQKEWMQFDKRGRDKKELVPPSMLKSWTLTYPIVSICIIRKYINFSNSNWKFENKDCTGGKPQHFTGSKGCI